MNSRRCSLNSSRIFLISSRCSVSLARIPSRSLNNPGISERFASSLARASSISARCLSSTSLRPESSAFFALSCVYKLLWCSRTPLRDSCASSYCLIIGLLVESFLISSIIFLSSLIESDEVCCWCSSALILRSISSTEKKVSSERRRWVRSCCCFLSSSAAEIWSWMLRFSCCRRRDSWRSSLYLDLAMASSELGSPRPLSCESSDSLIPVSRACSSTILASSTAMRSLSTVSSGFATFFRSFSVSGFLSASSAAGASAAGASPSATTFSSSSAIERCG
mmetsp:Transcript_33861/g.92901  ORF Transcript_33861/g.92901 Transcript_33861/m.92901 type:complete len:280 (+) Transcript_33861:1301-2140(+)